eukprot:g4318.t1
MFEREKASALTIRALVFGIILGSLTAAQNCFFAFRYGWTTMGNTTAAILGCGMLKLSDRYNGKRKANPRENTVLQTTAVAAASMVGGASLPFAVFAMSNQLRKYNSYPGDNLVGGGSTFDPTFGQLVLFCFALCYFGFFLAVPLRARLVKRMRLPFPYATASAEAIKSLHSSNTGDSTVALMLKALCAAIIFKFSVWTVKDLENFPIFGNLMKSRYHWKMNLSPANLGQGFLVEPRYVISQLFGSFLASGIILPVAYWHRGKWFAEGAKGFEGLDAFYILPAITIIVVDSIWKVFALALSSGQIAVSSVQRRYHHINRELVEDDQENREEVIIQAEKKSFISSFARVFGVYGDVMSPSGWLAGVIVTGLMPIFIFPFLFPRSNTYQVVLAVFAGPLWAIGIGESVGVTGSNLASACGKLMICIFSVWEGVGTNPDEGFDHVVPVLALGALSIAIVDAAMDLVRDFKTAEIIGASPQAMLAAQFLGATVSCIVSSAMYLMLTSSVPSDAMPAVVSRSYRAIAVIFSGGFDALPDYIFLISSTCAFFALLNNILIDCFGVNKKYMPHTTAVGIGVYLLPGQSITVTVGLMLKMLILYECKISKPKSIRSLELSASQQSLHRNLLNETQRINEEYKDDENKDEDMEDKDHVSKSNPVEAKLKTLAAGFLAGDGIAGVCTGILLSTQTPPFASPF